MNGSSSTIPPETRGMAMLTHLSGLAGYLVPLGGVVVPKGCTSPMSMSVSQVRGVPPVPPDPALRPEPPTGELDPESQAASSANTMEERSKHFQYIKID